MQKTSLTLRRPAGGALRKGRWGPVAFLAGIVLVGMFALKMNVPSASAQGETSGDQLVYVVQGEPEKGYYVDLSHPALRGKKVVAMSFADAQSLGYPLASGTVSGDNVIRGEAVATGGGSSLPFPSESWRRQLSEATKSMQSAARLYVIVRNRDGSLSFVERSVLSLDVSADRTPGTSP